MGLRDNVSLKSNDNPLFGEFEMKPSLQKIIENKK